MRTSQPFKDIREQTKTMGQMDLIVKEAVYILTTSTEI
jgi:hypothetical protein